MAHSLAEGGARMGLEVVLACPPGLARAGEDAIFMHCLPAHRGEEVDAEVIDGPQARVWRQAANRLPTEQALLYTLCTSRAD